MAKIDEFGNLITAPGPLKDLYLETYSKRLENRDIAEGLEDLKVLKEDLWSRRLKIAANTKTPDWTIDQLNKVLKDLKPNKARGPDGLVNEIFHPVNVLAVTNGIYNSVRLLHFRQLIKVT